MKEQAMMSNALPLSNNISHYGATDKTKAGIAWDYDYMYSCVCDSSWSVGLDRGEYQVPEYFEPDCR